MNAFVVAWRTSRYLPVGMVRAIAASLAWIAWATRRTPVLRLEENLARVTGLEGRALRRLSRRGMGSAARYYAEILELPRVSGDTIDARVRFANPEAVREALRTHGHTVVALSHSGNWDLIGAYACRHLAPVTSVAEILRPRSVFDEFVAFREKLGMTIVGHEGSTTFRELIRLAKSQGGVIALVADRDMSGSGLPVTMWGHEVKVAAGPAALAVSTSSTLFGVMIHYERLRGARRRQARSRWGIVATFSEPILAPEGSTRDQVTSMTDSWVGFIEDAIAQHPQDWHMLQRFGWVS